jgi:putative acyl-CoA dehydrogenase
VLRALSRESETGAALVAELQAAKGLHAGFDDEVAALLSLLHEVAGDQAPARMLTERLALALQAAVLLRAGSPVAEAFCRSRIDGEHGLAMGTLPFRVDFAALIARALPQ